MATEDWDSIDNFDESFPDYNCAFLDILGYKSKASEFFDRRYNLPARLERAMETVLAANSVVAAALDTSRLTIEIVSDSIIMLEPSDRQGLGAMLPFASHFASCLSFENLLIRGGIARGKHCRRVTKHGLDFLASEALQKAYLLESKRAIYPRILVDPDLARDLPSVEKALILREKEDFFVDFAHHVINRQGDNHEIVLAEMHDLKKEMNRHQDDSTRYKYQWLLDYYFWTIDQNPHWDSDAFLEFKSAIDRGFSHL